MRQEKLLAAKLQRAMSEDAQGKTPEVYSLQAGQTGRLTEEKDSFTILVVAHVITMILIKIKTGA